MNLLTQPFPASIAIYVLTSAESIKKDPLIDYGGETLVDIGVILLAIGLVITVKIISPRVEHAILLAIFLSLALMGFFLIR
ncbi:hypothetical protein [Allocoleopsis sp.]|uniref:hypothetical protein n=1 Tax=Allocoleopsis sp. TaxID=3088169 RepID=UPI002FCFE9DE